VSEYKQDCEKRPRDFALSVRHTVSRLQMVQAREPIDHIIKRDMARRIAAHIVHERLAVTESRHSTHFDLTVYVLSADELYALINREAQKIAFQPYNVDLGPNIGE
jgi:hypothetical protein